MSERYWTGSGWETDRNKLKNKDNFRFGVKASSNDGDGLRFFQSSREMTDYLGQRNVFGAAAQEKPQGFSSMAQSTSRQPLPEVGFSSRGSDSVATNLSGLLRDNGRYIGDARKQGMKAASSRGLMNSSLAAGSAEASAIRAALPIAQQDAQAEANRRRAYEEYLYGRQRDSEGYAANEQIEMRRQEFQSGESMLDREFQAGENTAQRQFTSGENLLERTFQSGENQQQRDFQAGESEEEREFRLASEARDRKFQSGENQQQREFQSGENAQDRAISAAELASREQQSQLDRDLQTIIANMNIDASEREGVARMLTSYDSIYAQQFNAIMSNPNLNASDREAAIRGIAADRGNGIALTEQAYGVRIDFGNESNLSPSRIADLREKAANNPSRAVRERAQSVLADAGL